MFAQITSFSIFRALVPCMALITLNNSYRGKFIPRRTKMLLWVAVISAIAVDFTLSLI